MRLYPGTRARPAGTTARFTVMLRASWPLLMDTLPLTKFTTTDSMLHTLRTQFRDMTTNTVGTKLIKPVLDLRLPMARMRLSALGLALVLAGGSFAQSQTVLGPWVPIFKGVEHARGTNTPGNGGFQDLQVVNVARVDLTDPDIRLFTTPRYTNYIAEYY